MCSRYEIRLNATGVAERFALKHVPDIKTTDEIRPTDFAPVILEASTCKLMRWGLIAPWDTKPVINARGETLEQKNLFQGILGQRCLIPATGYFEWRHQGRQRLKNRISREDEAPFAFAGLHNGTRFVIVTRKPAPEIAHIHSRMPVILARQSEMAWLDTTQPFDAVRTLADATEDPVSLHAREDVPPAPAQGDLFS